MNGYSQKMNDYAKVLKRRLITSRLIGILGCLIGLACIVLYAYFHGQTQWQWTCLVLLGYSLGTIFMQNCNLQAVKNGNPWERVNGICAILMFLLDIFILSYAMASGNLIVW